MFIIIFNGALLRPAIPKLNILNLKYIEDLSVLMALNLKISLIPDPVERMKPLTHDERTAQLLPFENNRLQEQLDCLEKVSSQKNNSK